MKKDRAGLSENLYDEQYFYRSMTRFPVSWMFTLFHFLFNILKSTLFQKQEDREIKQFLYCTYRNSSNVSVAAETVISILNAVQMWQASIGDDGPVLLTYR